MKTRTVFAILALAAVLAACKKNTPEPKTDGVAFSATLSIGDGYDSKALSESGSNLEASWAEGEKVALIHNGANYEMTVSAVSSGSATISGTIKGTPADGDKVTLIYPASAADGATGTVKADLLAEQDGTLKCIAEMYDVRLATATLKVGQTASLNGNVKLEYPYAIAKFSLFNAANAGGIIAKSLSVTIGSDERYTITPEKASDVLYVILPAFDALKLSIDATDTNNKTYTIAEASSRLEAGSYHPVNLAMREYVAMGDGLKWATMNVGAKNPWESGDYFAWGETEPYYLSGHAHDNPCSDWKDGKGDGYIWASYFDTTDGGTTFIKYKKGEKEILDLEDDAANANWHGTWRTPTFDEWKGIFDKWSELGKYTLAWTDDYLGDGSNHCGRIVTSMIPGYEGNQIFLPAGGDRFHMKMDGEVGTVGTYWSSCLSDIPNHSSASASLFRFSSDDHPGLFGARYFSRYNGLSVRPVMD